MKYIWAGILKDFCLLETLGALLGMAEGVGFLKESVLCQEWIYFSLPVCLCFTPFSFTPAGDPQVSERELSCPVHRDGHHRRHWVCRYAENTRPPPQQLRGQDSQLRRL